MRSIHDALRDSPEWLREPLRLALAGLFAREDLLADISARLLVFSRQGVPASPPPPHFSAECTPPLADIFAPFQPVLAAWHEQPSSPEIPRLLADAITVAGVPSLLVLAGMRLTPASITDGSALPPLRSQLLASALTPHSPVDGLSVAGRALAKHTARSPESAAFWGEAKGSSQEKNAAAERLLSRILDEATWWNVFVHYKHEQVYEARVPTGQGARWSAKGDLFIGFLEPFED